jgi:YggT family protein
MLLGMVRANFYNPISQFLVKLTNPVIIPLRRIVPAIGKLDTAALTGAIGLKIVQVILVALIGATSVNLGTIILIVIGDLLRMVVWIFIIALVVQAVISWVGNTHGNPVDPLLRSLTEPLLRPIRKFVPLIGMVDLSPLVAILFLQVLLMVIQAFGL